MSYASNGSIENVRHQLNDANRKRRTGTSSFQNLNDDNAALSSNVLYLQNNQHMYSLHDPNGLYTLNGSLDYSDHK